MKLEDQVISLELAKKLQELGVSQNSLFYHQKVQVARTGECDIKIQQKKGIYPCWSAYTASELMEILPEKLRVSKNEIKSFTLLRSQGKYFLRYGLTYFMSSDIEDTKPVDALAKMLIYLIENKLLETEKICIGS